MKDVVGMSDESIVSGTIRVVLQAREYLVREKRPNVGIDQEYRYVLATISHSRSVVREDTHHCFINLVGSAKSSPDVFTRLSP